MLKVRITAVFCLFILIIISGCTTISNNLGINYTSGVYIYPEKLSQIKTGLSQKEVFELLGSPSLTSTFNNNTWFYVYQKTWYIAVFREKLLDQQILILSFNNNGTLTQINQKTIKDIPHLSYDKDNTFLYYKKNNIDPDLFH